MTWDQLVDQIRAERYTLPPVHVSDTRARQAARRAVLSREVDAFDRDHRGDRTYRKVAQR